jgi:hypothetical protein
MNVVSSAVLTTEPVTSEGVVAASVYVEGRRVANIAIDEASSWRAALSARSAATLPHSEEIRIRSLP